MPTIAPNHLDIRTVPAAERETAIFERLESLDPGESFLLLLETEPRPLLAACQAQRFGAFDWSLLEEGPPAWRVEIRRRRLPDTRRGIREFLQWDHERLDLTLMEATRLAASGDRAAAAVRFAEFCTRLRRHIRMEEELLFPAFERATGAAGPTAQMLHEHVEIQGLLGPMAAAIASDERPDRFPEIRKRFLSVLGHHNAKEERIVYPMSDQRLAPSEREALVLAMQGL